VRRALERIDAVTNLSESKRPRREGSTASCFSSIFGKRAGKVCERFSKIKQQFSGPVNVETDGACHPSRKQSPAIPRAIRLGHLPTVGRSE